MKSKDESIPIGLSESGSIPRADLGVQADAVLFPRTDEERLDWLVSRLDRQLDHPLFAPGSGALARQILDVLPSDPLRVFAKKLLLTLRDGEMHSCMLLQQHPPRVGVCFVAWRGTWQDVIGKRYGLYLNSFFSCMDRMSNLVGQLDGFLEIDAFIEEEILEDEPLRDRETCVTLDIEYSYCPGWPLDSAASEDTGMPNVILINRSLCSDEEKVALARLAAR